MLQDFLVFAFCSEYTFRKKETQRDKKKYVHGVVCSCVLFVYVVYVGWHDSIFALRACASLSCVCASFYNLFSFFFCTVVSMTSG